VFLAETERLFFTVRHVSASATTFLSKKREVEGIKKERKKEEREREQTTARDLNPNQLCSSPV